MGKADEVGEETGTSTLPPRRDLDPSILGKTCRDNVGNGHLPAGAGSNLQRPLVISVLHEVPAEEFGRAHELVGAMKKG